MCISDGPVIATRSISMIDEPRLLTPNPKTKTPNWSIKCHNDLD